MHVLIDLFTRLQLWLFEALVQPALFAIGGASLLEDAYAATAWFLVGVVQIIVLLVVIGPLQRWRPVEAVRDRATTRVDVLYTLIHRLGIFRVALFLLLGPWLDQALGALRTAGYGTFHLDQLWPGVSDIDWVSFVLYLVVFDFAAYWMHRGQHHFQWWWRLHALHHAQQQMTMWSDNRNHFLDDVLIDIMLVVMAQLIGVAPEQFIAIVALTQLSESLQHANLRLAFGRWGDRLWVSPRFHRAHHSVGNGHESFAAGHTPASTPKRVVLGGHNFGVLLPWWDMLFGTANLQPLSAPTGVRDQIETQRDYGRGLWAQQWLGCKRLFGKA